MDDLMSKLQNVLNDEESMKQIKELAAMLGNDMNEAENQPATPQDNKATDFSQLLASLGGMSGNTAKQNDNPAHNADNNPLGSLDIAKLAQLSTILSQANKPDKNVDLLLALRPLLKEENQIKIDRLVKIFKLFAIYPLLKESGLLGGDLFGLL